METTLRASVLAAALKDFVAKHHTGEKINEVAEIIDAKVMKIYEAEVDEKDLVAGATDLSIQ